MLAAEPEMKRGRDYPESSKNNCPFCAFHNVHSYNTHDCQELRALREGRISQCPEHSNRG